MIAILATVLLFIVALFSSMRLLNIPYSEIRNIFCVSRLISHELKPSLSELEISRHKIERIIVFSRIFPNLGADLKISVRDNLRTKCGLWRFGLYRLLRRLTMARSQPSGASPTAFSNVPNWRRDRALSRKMRHARARPTLPPQLRAAPR